MTRLHAETGAVIVPARDGRLRDSARMVQWLASTAR